MSNSDLFPKIKLIEYSSWVIVSYRIWAPNKINIISICEIKIKYKRIIKQN